MQSSIPSVSKPLYVGCAVWAYKGWVGSFFPAKTKQADFLREYSRRLTTVEGNTTFYAVPSAEIIERWVEQTPPGFKFCPKFPQSITHLRRLKDAKAETRDFLERMSGLGDRLGPLFIQLPPSFGPVSFPVLETYLSEIPVPFRIAVEVRHPAWFEAAGRKRLNALLEQHRAARVTIDTRGLREGASDDLRVDRSREQKPYVPVQPDSTTDFAFVRLILNPNSELNEPYLGDWIDRITEWIKANIVVYAFCHCPDDTLSPSFARALYARVALRTGIPPLPAEPEQAALL
jgi:uncharacterized protein YecE (DUF72 family)